MKRVPNNCTRLWTDNSSCWLEIISALLVASTSILSFIQKVTLRISLILHFFLFCYAWRCDAPNGKVSALLSRTSLCHFPGRKGWTEVPCTRLEKGTAFFPPSLRARSVPIIPSFQACDPEEGNAGGSDRNKEGPLKWYLTLDGKTAKPFRCSPAGDTDWLMPASAPNRAISPAEAATNVELGKSLNPAPRSSEIAVKLTQNWREKSFSRSVSQNDTCAGLNPLENKTVQESDEKRVKFSSQVLPPGSRTRGLQAQGQRHGQTRLVNTATNSTKGPGCRGPGKPSAGPFASWFDEPCNVCPIVPSNCKPSTGATEWVAGWSTCRCRMDQ